MKKTALILCAVLGSLGGALLTVIVTVGFLLVGMSEGGDGYDLMIFASLIMLAACIPTGILRNKLKRRFGIPAPVFIACTCAVPLIWSIIERAKHLNALENDGYNYFMGGLSAGLTEVFTRIGLTAAMAFLVGQCAAALISHSKNNAQTRG